MSDNNNKNSLKNLFNKNSSLGSKLTTKTYKSSNDFIVNEELEGTEFLKQKSKEINNFKFNVDYSDPANFAKFASAYLYYRDSINYTLDSFPYDGSKEKHQTWRNQSTDLDKYLIDKEWPRYSGYLNMGGDVSDAIDPTEDGWYYGLETVQQYEFIQINGYAENSLYSSTDKKNDAFNLSFADGFTIEFFMRFPSDKEFGAWPLFSPRQPIFSLATDDDFSFNLIFDASSSTVKFGVNYYTSAGGSELPDDGDEFCFIETDMSNSYDLWNHVAVIFNIDNIKVYVNGRLSGTRAFPAVTTPEIITLDEWNLRGLLGVCCKYTSFHGKLWAHLDEFRIWKEPRTEKQINDNMFCNVRGTATELNKESNLSVYYKFNEPDESGNVIIDYSGRLVNGNFVAFGYTEQDYLPNFSSQGRRVKCSDSDPSPLIYENGDIILYDNNVDFVSFKNQFLQIGLDYDAENGKTLFQRLPSWMSEEDTETTEDLKKLTQIMGSYLDNLFIKISFLSKLKQVSYNEIGNEEFYKFAIKNLGFPVIEIFDSADTINLFLDKDNELSFEEKLSDIKSTIYQNLYNNIVPILKTKGTKNSVDILLKSLSVPDNLYNLNFYANTDVVHDGKLKDYYKNVSFLNFNYNDADLSLYGESLTTSPLLKIDHLYDYETNIKIKVPTYDTTNYNNISSSIVSLHSIEKNISLYSLYYVRKNNISNEIKLVANYFTSGSTSYSLETEFFNTKNSYLDIFVGFSRESGLTSGSITPDIFNIMVTIDRNETIFISSSLSSITSSYIDNFYDSNYIYELNAGRNRISNIFSNIAVSNISLSRISNISQKSNLDDSIQGIKSPWQQNFNGTENNFNQMFFNFDLSTFEFGDGIHFYNNCSNVMRDYEFDENDLEEYILSLAISLDTAEETRDKFYIIDKVNLKKKENPGEYNIDNDVQVLDGDDEFFTKDSRPINVFFNLERSVYGILNDRMMKVFKTFEDFATIYSPQIEFYRVENKNLIKLRNELFKTIDNEIDVDRFQEYYKWLDYDLSQALSSIIPASANSDRKAKNVIESHNLERNKMTRYLLAGTTPKKVTNEAIISEPEEVTVSLIQPKLAEIYPNETVYSTNLTKLTGSQFGNYSNNRENVQYGEIGDNNPGFKQALFVASGDDLNNLTQSVIPARQVNVMDRPTDDEDAEEYLQNTDYYNIYTFGTANYSVKESSYKQRFSAPGEYWNSAFNSVYTSPYGTVNYRNIRVNKYLNTRYALPSLFGGLESGSTTTGSIHKTYRNSNSSSMYYEYDRNNSWHTPFNADLPRAKFDNFFVQHAIPNNIRRYSDLVVFDRSQKVYYSIYHAELYKNMILGSYIGYRNSGSALYVYGQEGLSFDPDDLTRDAFISTTNRMYDTIVRVEPIFDERLTSVDVASSKEDLFDRFYGFVSTSWVRGYYNAYFLKLSAPNWVGWTQLRSSNNQIFDYMKKNNLVTKTQIIKNWLNPSTIEITENNSFVSQSFINFDNHDYEIDIEYTSYNFETGKEEVKKETVYTQKPFKLLNSNKDLAQKVLPNLSEFNKIKDNKFIKINKIRYISSLYPKNEYVGLSDIRDKKEWTQTDSSIRLFNRRTFWRDDYNNRLVTSARTSQGVIKDTLSIFSQDGYNLTSENDVGEIFYIKDDNASYSIKPYIQYLSSMALVEFYETSYNRNFSNIFNQTDKRPYFDTYQSYIEGLRKYSSHSIIPEYNISQNTSSIDGRVDQTLLVQNSGTIFESNNFYDYITTNQIVANNPIKAKIKASAIKKLNPYKGFYPAEYTTILAEAFSSSYGDCFSGSFIETLAGANNGAEHTPANNNSTKTGFIGALKTIFGPGVLYNSLKSGLGTDYLLPFSGSTDKTFYNDGRDGLNASLTTLKTLNKLKFEQVYSSNPIIPSKSFFEYDFIGPEKARIIDYRLVKQASNQQFYKKINNFLSETEEFFINKKVINSKKENNFKFKKDNVYVMNINVFKTENYFNIAGISSSASAIELDTFRGSVFGPAAAAPLIAQVGAGILSDALYSVVDFPQENTASVAIDSFASYVHYTPSYYYNAFSTNIILTASKDSYSIDEIFSSASLETILNKNNDLLLFNVYVDNNVVAKNLWPSYNNRNNVENSIDLFNKKYFVKEGKFGEIKTIEENIDNPAWTIEPKFESPLLYFGEIQNYPSGGGMWMDYGTYSDTEGVYLSISDVSGTLSLADAVGFEKKDYRIGELKEQKEIEECLILVPVDKLGNKLFTSEKKDERELILDKYVFPSNLDWKFNKKIRPFIFHAIEFSSVLSRDDLADIWQGLMPSLSYKMEEDDKVLDIDLSDIEKNQIKKGLSYIVFKVKKRARYDFQKYKNGEKDDQRYSYNWPYDYCSLVELCKIDIEIEEEV